MSTEPQLVAATAAATAPAPAADASLSIIAAPVASTTTSSTSHTTKSPKASPSSYLSVASNSNVRTAAANAATNDSATLKGVSVTSASSELTTEPPHPSNSAATSTCASASPAASVAASASTADEGTDSTRAASTAVSASAADGGAVCCPAAARCASASVVVKPEASPAAASPSVSVTAAEGREASSPAASACAPTSAAEGRETTSAAASTGASVTEAASTGAPVTAAAYTGASTDAATSTCASASAVDTKREASSSGRGSTLAKGGFLRSGLFRSSATSNSQTKTGTHHSPQGNMEHSTHETIAWDLDVENAFLEACLSTLTYATCRDLERRVRSGSGTEDRARLAPCCGPPPTSVGATEASKHTAASCCTAEHSGHHTHEGERKDGAACSDENHSEFNGGSHAFSRPVPYTFKKDREDHLGELMDSWMTPTRLRDLLGRIAGRAAKVFDNVINRGKADGMEVPTGQEEKQLRLEILKEALIREVQLRIVEEVHEEKKRDCREGGMLANPLAFSKGHLSHLLPETIAALMKDGVAVQHAFVGEKVRQMILDEVELLEYDGQFNEVFQQSLNPVRKDYMCWVSLSDLDREKQQGLWQLFQSMQALPYELNKKAHLCLQLAVYQADGAYYRRHMDAGFSPALDNGRKITAIYYPNSPDWKPSDGGYLRVYERWKRKEQLAMAPGGVAAYEAATSALREIVPAGDTLVLLRSREMPHEVLETHRKRFAISLWMSGPPGPGDDD